MSRYEIREATTNAEFAALEYMEVDTDKVQEEFHFNKNEFFKWVMEMKPYLKERLVILYIFDNEENKPVGALVSGDFRAAPISDSATPLFYYSNAPAKYNAKLITESIQRMADLGVSKIRLETKNPRLYTKYGFKETGHVAMILEI